MNNDIELIQKAQSGNMKAFNDLVNKYDREVLNIAYSYKNLPEDAKDIYQEVFIRVYKGIKNFKFQSEFSTWLFRITTNVCLTHKSKLSKEKLFTYEENYSNEENKNNISINVKSNDYADTKIKNEEISLEIQKALNNLTEKQRLIFILKYMNELKIKEIAKMLKYNEGTVKRYLFEASHKMRNQLKEYYE